MNKVIASLSRPLVQMTFIVVIGFLSYANSFTVPFQLDDVSSLLMNPLVSDPQLLFNSAGTNNRFIGYLSFALNYSLHGFTVVGFHVFNLVIHLGNAILIYWLMMLTFRTPYFSGFALSDDPFIMRLRLVTASFAALLFVSHPVQTQAVTYIIQRLTSLATLLCLLSLVAYVQARLIGRVSRKKAIVYYLIAIVASIFSMKTKEMAFTFPLVIATYEFLFFEGKPNKRFLYLTPFFLAMLIIPLALLSIYGTSGNLLRSLDEASRLQTTLPRQHYLFTQLSVIVTYIRLLIFPVNQNVYYDYPTFTSFLDPQVFSRFLLLLSIFSVGIYLAFRSRLELAAGDPLNRLWFRLISFGIFWFFITLSVESSIIPIQDVIFEHRVYLPSIGFFTAMAGGFGLIQARWGRYTHINRFITLIMITVVIGAFVATVARNNVWKSELALWQDTVHKSPNKALPHYQLGLLYYNLDHNDEAVREFETSVSLEPFASPLPHYHLGTIYYEQGRLEDAERSLFFSIQLKQNSPYAYQLLGNIYVKQGRIKEAVRAYTTALTYYPNFVEAREQLDLLNAVINKNRGINKSPDRR